MGLEICGGGSFFSIRGDGVLVSEWIFDTNICVYGKVCICWVPGGEAIAIKIWPIVVFSGFNTPSPRSGIGSCYYQSRGHNSAYYGEVPD